MTGNHIIKQLQKKVTFSTAHVPQKVLTYKYETFNVGNNVTCRR
jgi:hypothetical protein